MVQTIKGVPTGDLEDEVEAVEALEDLFLTGIFVGVRRSFSNSY